MTAQVAANSLVTLHYRLALGDDTELMSTFGGAPATLQLGSGELAPTLERCLAGIGVGERHVFLLEPEQAFGPHNPKLVQRWNRSELPAEPALEPLAMIEFKTEDGASYAGTVRELAADYAVIDFNHPLAGKALRWEVEVIGVIG